MTTRFLFLLILMAAATLHLPTRRGQPTWRPKAMHRRNTYCASDPFAERSLYYKGYAVSHLLCLLSPRLRALGCLHDRWDSYPAGTIRTGAGLSPEWTFSISSGAPAHRRRRPRPSRQHADRDQVDGDDHHRNGCKPPLREHVPRDSHQNGPRNAVKQPDPVLNHPREGHPHQPREDSHTEGERRGLNHEERNRDGEHEPGHHQRQHEQTVELVVHPRLPQEVLAEKTGDQEAHAEDHSGADEQGPRGQPHRKECARHADDGPCDRPRDGHGEESVAGKLHALFIERSGKSAGHPCLLLHFRGLTMAAVARRSPQSRP